MESEKVKEIKKLLRCMNGEKACTNCYINDIADEQETCCINVVADMTLDLINELESENERLIEERDLYKSQFNELEPRFLDLMWDNNEQKDRIAELEKERSEQLKQFAERLKEISCEMYLKEQLHRCIDETLKEFIRDKK